MAGQERREMEASDEGNCSTAQTADGGGLIDILEQNGASPASFL